MSAEHLCLTGVTRIYSAFEGHAAVHALGPIDLSLKQGEFFSVVGPSGCGKSTLLDVIAGLARQSDGTILFEGKPIAGAVPDGIGVVFQEDASFPWLTVTDNAAFALRRAGVAETEVRERVQHTLAFTGLSSFAQAYPAQLSGGMRQRLSAPSPDGCGPRCAISRSRLSRWHHDARRLDPLGSHRRGIRLARGRLPLRICQPRRRHPAEQDARRRLARAFLR